jgi:hypothetical protein
LVLRDINPAAVRTDTSGASHRGLLGLGWMAKLAVSVFFNHLAIWLGAEKSANSQEVGSLIRWVFGGEMLAA